MDFVAVGDNLGVELEINKKYVLWYFLKLVIFYQIFFSFDVENEIFRNSFALFIHQNKKY